MPRSNWGERLAFVGAFLVACAGIGAYWWMFYDMGASTARNEERARIEREHYAADAPERVEKECSGLDRPAQLKCVLEIVNSQRESQRNESDLAAQWKAADWVAWASILAGAQLISTLLGLYYVKRTLDATLLAVEDTGEATEAMKEANRIAATTADAQLRPYLSIDDALHFDTHDSGLSWVVRFKITNHGQLPAKQIKVTSKSYIGNPFTAESQGGLQLGREDTFAFIGSGKPQDAETSIPFSGTLMTEILAEQSALYLRIVFDYVDDIDGKRTDTLTYICDQYNVSIYSLRPHFGHFDVPMTT